MPRPSRRHTVGFPQLRAGPQSVRGNPCRSDTPGFGFIVAEMNQICVIELLFAFPAIRTGMTAFRGTKHGKRWL